MLDRPFDMDDLGPTTGRKALSKSEHTPRSNFGVKQQNKYFDDNFFSNFAESDGDLTWADDIFDKGDAEVLVVESQHSTVSTSDKSSTTNNIQFAAPSQFAAKTNSGYDTDGERHSTRRDRNIRAFELGLDVNLLNGDDDATKKMDLQRSSEFLFACGVEDLPASSPQKPMKRRTPKKPPPTLKKSDKKSATHSKRKKMRRSNSDSMLKAPSLHEFKKKHKLDKPKQDPDERSKASKASKASRASRSSGSNREKTSSSKSSSDRKKVKKRNSLTSSTQKPHKGETEESRDQKTSKSKKRGEKSPSVDDLRQKMKKEKKKSKSFRSTKRSKSGDLRSNMKHGRSRSSKSLGAATSRSKDLKPLAPPEDLKQLLKQQNEPTPSKTLGPKTVDPKSSSKSTSAKPTKSTKSTTAKSSTERVKAQAPPSLDLHMGPERRRARRLKSSASLDGDRDDVSVISNILDQSRLGTVRALDPGHRRRHHSDETNDNSVGLGNHLSTSVRNTQLPPRESMSVFGGEQRYSKNVGGGTLSSNASLDGRPFEQNPRNKVAPGRSSSADGIFGMKKRGGRRRREQQKSPDLEEVSHADDKSHDESECPDSTDLDEILAMSRQHRVKASHNTNASVESSSKQDFITVPQLDESGLCNSFILSPSKQPKDGENNPNDSAFPPLSSFPASSQKSPTNSIGSGDPTASASTFAFGTPSDSPFDTRPFCDFDGNDSGGFDDLDEPIAMHKKKNIVSRFFGGRKQRF